MAAVAASYVAVAAVYGSAVAVDAVKANETAWATLTGATSAVMGKAVAVLSGLNPDSYADGRGCIFDRYDGYCCID